MSQPSVRNYDTPKNRRLVWILSIGLAVAVGALFVIPKIPIGEGLRNVVRHFPAFNATVNGTTFFVLIGALIAIKRKNIPLHKKLVFVAMTLSVIFLLTYVIYHITFEHTVYAGKNRTLYLIILNSHILLSAIIVPLVLFSFIRGMSMAIERHRKIAKITLPLWLYVTATGVIVYLMISPFYTNI